MCHVVSARVLSVILTLHFRHQLIIEFKLLR